MSDSHTKPDPALQLTREEALAFFSKFFYGEHHIPTGKNGLQPWGFGWTVRIHGSLATFDGAQLTRLVFLAHEMCIRAEVSTSWNMLRIAIHKRDPEGTRFYRRHPSLDQAVAEWKAGRL